MKDEIKEILYELNDMFQLSELEQQVKDIEKIFDYITNLQEDNERLKADNIFLKNEISKLAKKYLKNDLLNILGGDEE